MLEWAVPEEREIGDIRAAKMGNPASWITAETRQTVRSGEWRSCERELGITHPR
jgi:hypothetical protein